MSLEINLNNFIVLTYDLAKTIYQSAGCPALSKACIIRNSRYRCNIYECCAAELPLNTLESIPESHLKGHKPSKVYAVKPTIAYESSDYEEIFRFKYHCSNFDPERLIIIAV